MSRLEEIRERLYAKRAARLVPPKTKAVPDSGGEDATPQQWTEGPSASPRLMDRFYLARLSQRRLSMRTVIAFGLLAFAVVAAFVGYGMFFDRASVRFEIIGPGQITAGDPTTVTLRVVNRSQVAITDGVITLTLPPGSARAGEANTPLSLEPVRERIGIDSIPSGAEVSRELRVQFLGSSGVVERISGVFTYRPENVQSSLTRRAEFSAPIVRVPVGISVDAPEQIGAGEELTISVGVSTETPIPIAAMALGIEFPPGFDLISAQPAPPAGTLNRWPLGDLTAGTSTRIVLRGTLSGEPGEHELFLIRLGRYDPSADSWLILTETSAGPTIASPFLLVRTALDGNRRGPIMLGQRLEGRVQFKNTLAQPIQNLTVTLAMPERLVDFSTLQAEGGFYDATRRLLVWNPASSGVLKELGPGVEDEFAFSFALKATPPIRSFADKNFRFPITTTIDTGTPPPDFRGISLAYRDRIEFEVASRLTLAARAAYRDSPVPNTGPLPPRVGQTTTYTVFLQLGSGANDVQDVSVRALLAGGVEFRGAISSDIGSVEFNEASRELVWRVGRLAAATGILRPHSSVVIQLALTPAENQAGISPPLLIDIRSSGRDTFANQDLSAAAENVTTELRTDSPAGPEEWRVVP